MIIKKNNNNNNRKTACAVQMTGYYTQFNFYDATLTCLVSNKCHLYHQLNSNPYINQTLKKIKQSTHILLINMYIDK